jgi:hypothetical protein
MRVAFDEPEHGWLGLKLRSGQAEFSEAFSHIYPSLATLCEALSDIARARVGRTVVFLLEPRELEFRFGLDNHRTCTLTAVLFSDTHRDRDGDVVFQHSAPSKDIVLSFWRALRRLETCLPAAEFAARWREPFPSAEMAALTSVVTAFKAGRDPSANHAG